MSWLSSAIGAIGNIWSSNQANSSAFEMQANSIAAQKEAMQNKYQWAVEDLKKAGLNPILAVTNGVNSSVSGATSNITAADVAGGMLAGANSAQARKATELMEKELQVKQTNANANKTTADAKKLEAENDIQKTANDTARTNSGIALNESNIKLNNTYLGYYTAMTDNVKNRTQLETALNNAQIREIDQRIINATLEVGAKVQYYKDTGQAALIGASAQARNAAAQEIIAETAAANGISQRVLNAALTDKGRAETADLMAKAAKTEWETAKSKSENQYAQMSAYGSGFDKTFGDTLNRGAELLRKVNPLQGLFSP